MSTNLVLLIIAAVLSLPGGLFMAYIMSLAKARWAALLGGIIGAAVVAGGVYYFVTAGDVSVEGLSYFLGAFFACSMGVFMGALVANFLIGSDRRSSSISGMEI